MRNRPASVPALLLAGLLAACATAPEPSGPPDLTPAAGEAAPARAELYADCIGQAATAGTYDRMRDPDTTLLRFTCTGEPARAFDDALGDWSARQESEWTAAGRTWRSTNRVRRDLFGVDYCSTGGPDDHQCVIVLNTGSFLDD